MIVGVIGLMTWQLWPFLGNLLRPTDMPLLSLAIWLPILAGVLLLAFGRDDHASGVRWFALLAALASFLVTIPLVTDFNLATAAMQFGEKHAWIARFNVWYTSASTASRSGSSCSPPSSP